MADHEIKTFNVRVPKEMWVFLKYHSIHNETSLNAIVNQCLIKYKKNIDNKLNK